MHKHFRAQETLAGLLFVTANTPAACTCSCLLKCTTALHASAKMDRVLSSSQAYRREHEARTENSTELS